MRILTSISLAFLFILFCGQTIDIKKDKYLFLIIENDRAGFIDSSGTVIIKPIFRYAHNFSEGVASVSLNGMYGYIDETGNFVIPEQFDYAEPFKDSIAIVHKDGKPYYVNHNGEKLFDCNYQIVTEFKDNRARVMTSTNKIGCINRQGKLVVDTIYKYISEFNEGLAIVTGIKHGTRNQVKKIDNYEIAIIDSNGKYIIPFGICADINNYIEGYYVAELVIKEKKERMFRYQGIINSRGNFLFKMKTNGDTCINSDVHCGLAKIRFNKYEQTEYGNKLHSFYGFINLKGDIILNDTNILQACDYSCNRTYIRNKNLKGKIIDTKMNTILDSIYCDYNFAFVNGMAIVEKNNNWGLIDTNGIFLVGPIFQKIEYDKIVGNFFFFYKDSLINNEFMKKYTGIVRTDGKIIMEPIIENFYGGWYSNGLLQFHSNGKINYINNDGKLIWQQKEDENKSIDNLNIDFMKSGYFHASTKYHINDLNEFRVSDNQQIKTTNLDSFPTNSFSIIIKQDEKKIIDNKYNGIKVYLINTTSNDIIFEAQNRRLNMVVQAKDTKGEWRDIEYLPNSWCGNSYHYLTLESNKYWHFTTPVYEGILKTKLRIRLEYIDTKDIKNSKWKKKIITLFSNEYDGSVNPAQFWRKREYYPSNVMEPYNE
jgi:hypothetical protein